MSWWSRRRKGSRRARSRRDVSPDDPRTSAFALELVREREGDPDVDRIGESEWLLIWSGPLPPDLDEAAAVNALVQERWWHFNGKGKLDEVADEGWVFDQLTWLFGTTMAYDTVLMPRERAAELAARFVALIPEPRRWFTNHQGFPDPTAWNPATDFTFDAGYVATAEGRAWIAWFTDED